MHIPLSSPSAMAQHEFLPITREIGNWNCRLPIANFRWLRTRRGTLDVGRWMFFFFRRPNDCPHRNLHDFVRTRAAAHFFPHPVPAAFRLDQGLVEEIGEIIDVPVRPQAYVTTTPALPARRFTFPPRPPSPPSGPPFGTNFSRRKLTDPRPPFPACAKTFIRSTNMAGSSCPPKGHTSSPANARDPRC